MWGRWERQKVREQSLHCFKVVSFRSERVGGMLEGFVGRVEFRKHWWQRGGSGGLAGGGGRGRGAGLCSRERVRSSSSGRSAVLADVLFGGGVRSEGDIYYIFIF